MDDTRTMAQLLEAPTVGYEDAIIVPEITADNFELKHGVRSTDLLDKNPSIGYNIGMILLRNSSTNFSLLPNNYLRNEITRFQQRFDETFYEAWDRFNDLLQACPHHGFSELHQLDTFYNALNSNDQDSLNSLTVGVGLSSSTPGISPDVAELKDMVKALLLDKKSQAPTPVKRIAMAILALHKSHDIIVWKKLSLRTQFLLEWTLDLQTVRYQPIEGELTSCVGKEAVTFYLDQLCDILLISMHMEGAKPNRHHEMALAGDFSRSLVSLK
ncbi:reverse transcriptase domain-containing protein [Tanacetum coccineum]|uniref:Reverse transcriptase domain-containing protein n=1 Tax=Tanacetum coccineum TaxID=301880 RepID=A0ABQ5HP90_9ASTR